VLANRGVRFLRGHPGCQSALSKAESTTPRTRLRARRGLRETRGLPFASHTTSGGTFISSMRTSGFWAAALTMKKILVAAVISDEAAWHG